MDLEELNKELEELNKAYKEYSDSYFMLQMQDRWGNDDFKYASMLRSKISKTEVDIRRVKSEIEKLESEKLESEKLESGKESGKGV